MKASLGNLRRGGHAVLADAIESLAEAIEGDHALDRVFKEQLFEQLEFLAQQAVIPEASRKHGVIRPVLMALDVGGRTTAAISKRWQKLHSLLIVAFTGFSEGPPAPKST